MVGRRPLNPAILVRSQAPEPCTAPGSPAVVCKTTRSGGGTLAVLDLARRPLVGYRSSPFCPFAGRPENVITGSTPVRAAMPRLIEQAQAF